MKPNSAQLRLLSDDDLDRELASTDHDEPTRQAILYERIRRGTQGRSRAHWTQWLTLFFALLAAILAGIAAWPVLSGLFENEWFDF